MALGNKYPALRQLCAPGRARTVHAIPLFHVAMFVLLLILMVLPFILKWFSTGSTYGLYIGCVAVSSSGKS